MAAQRGGRYRNDGPELFWPFGFKPDGDTGYVERRRAKVNLIAIDPKAKKIAVGDLKLELIERRFVSVLVLNPTARTNTNQSPRKCRVKESALSIPAAGMNLH